MGFGFSPLSLLAKQFLASTFLSRWFLCRHCLYRKRTRYPKSGRLVPTTLWYWFRTLSMADERLYDYSKGLNAPYWIQEIKTKKGTRLWYFATPMQLSFFIVFTFVFVAMLLSWFLSQNSHTLFHYCSIGTSPINWLNSTPNTNHTVRRCTFSLGTTWFTSGISSSIKKPSTMKTE